MLAAIAAALRAAASGDAVATIEWAAAIDADPRLGDARLSPKEREVLALYASGEKSVSVAHAAGLSEKTVAEYVRRIRMKYAAVGRPAVSRVDLYKRAVEDGASDIGERRAATHPQHGGRGGDRRGAVRSALVPVD